MKSSSSLIVVVFVVVIALVQFSSQEGKFTATEKQAMLDRHNYYRTIVARGQVAGQPMASNMNLLTWDADLEIKAQTWVDKCLYSSSPPASRQAGKCYNSVVGENMWASPALDPTLNTASIDSWFSENVYYSFTTNTCAQGKTCGHYTQLVWANTTTVGCARNVCTGLPNTAPWKTFIVCNYCIGGNIIGKKPYIIGKSNL